jgi:hypothetical protein
MPKPTKQKPPITFSLNKVNIWVDGHPVRISRAEWEGRNA